MQKASSSEESSAEKSSSSPEEKEPASKSIAAPPTQTSAEKSSSRGEEVEEEEEEANNSTPAKLGPKRGAQVEATVSKASKRLRKQVESEQAEDETKTHSSQHVWSDADEINLLKGLISFKDENGDSERNLLPKNMDPFFEFVRRNLHFNVYISQLKDKLWRLRGKYLKGKGKTSRKPHQRQIHELCHIIWGDPMEDTALHSNGKGEKAKLELPSMMDLDNMKLRATETGAEEGGATSERRSTAVAGGEASLGRRPTAAGGGTERGRRHRHGYWSWVYGGSEQQRGERRLLRCFVRRRCEEEGEDGDGVEGKPTAAARGGCVGGSAGGGVAVSCSGLTPLVATVSKGEATRAARMNHEVNITIQCSDIFQN
ncbi:hypothetical protein Tsubulata_038287 [Turnera subulata]|uniref:Glabrous enhancer-binding protein-like DBD domain-containing protein n=1 Tax=Turnera subulata TaxID=218843 RepID=A0A9Q0FSA9_9ROSI|nr:hypothetical protein Tsubulata_038287 [Turnera subulata]